jgi:hypothetical protein
MIVLLLIVVTLWGVVLYNRWHDRRAFCLGAAGYLGLSPHADPGIGGFATKMG